MRLIDSIDDKVSAYTVIAVAAEPMFKIVNDLRADTFPFELHVDTKPSDQQRRVGPFSFHIRNTALHSVPRAA